MSFIRKQSPVGVPTILIGGSDRAGHFFKSTIIAASGVMKIGDIVSVVAEQSGNGIVMRRYNSAGDAIAGVCVGFGQASGAVVAFDATTNDTVTVLSTNETVAQIYAILDITPGAVYSASLSGTLHTTASGCVGAWADPNTGANAGQVLETSVTRTVVQGRGLALLGPDPENTTRVLCTVEETVFKTGIGV